MKAGFLVPQVNTARLGFWGADCRGTEGLHPSVMEEVLGHLPGRESGGRGCVPSVPAWLRGAVAAAAAWGWILSPDLVTLCCELLSGIVYQSEMTTQHHLHSVASFNHSHRTKTVSHVLGVTT